MKKLILGLVAIFLITALNAQDGEKAQRQAARALGAFNLDPSNNKEKLKEAVSEIDKATADAASSKMAKTWNTRGEIYNEIANQTVAIRQLGIGNEADLPKVEHPARDAAEAFMKAFELAEKKYEQKDALKGMQAAQGNLSNMGIYMYEDGKFHEAFVNFKEVVDIHNILSANKEKSSLDAVEDYNNQLYITGLAALNANEPAEAANFFNKLYDIKYEKPAIYEALYKIKSEETSPEQAYSYLAEGRKLFPDDVSLLFAEINHFLRINKLDELIGKLEMAIQKEPENVSLYSTLGNVYDNLYQTAQKDGDTAKASDYFEKAKSYYNQAMQKDPSYVDAIYSIGALYYNKAAAMTTELNKLADDYSKEGIAKYEKLKKDIFAEFDHALPYFKQAEALDPNDVNTLIALKEIFARKDDLAMSNEFKDRLDKVQGGGTNPASYFKKD
ncbi:MAG: hypothetical protein KDC66_07190 [Phaeodactylibacter sp.]|nr:hypothetical protein [Phaeodactylibacter sp.]MCB9275954.1 hypothetical protein [Lewinellaceae bacterium]